MKLNEKFKELRLKNNYSQKKMAQLLDVSLSTIQKIEYGDINLKNEMIIKICEVFDISIDEFLKNSDEINLKYLRNFAVHKGISTDEFLRKFLSEYIKKENEIKKRSGNIILDISFDNTEFDFRKIEKILEYIFLNGYDIKTDKIHTDIVEITDIDNNITQINYYEFIRIIELLYINFDSEISNIFSIFNNKNSKDALKEYRKKNKEK